MSAEKEGYYTLQELLDHLTKFNEKNLEVAEQILKVDGAKMFGLDLLAVSVSKRSMSLNTGFMAMIREENFICAAPLLRLQLDNALRFFAAFLVEDPHAMALACIDGTHINKFKDRDTGEKLTDAYLVRRLMEHHDWIDEVYKHTCGYVHLSEKHFYNAFGKVDRQAKLSMAIGDRDQFITEKERAEAVYAMIKVTEVVLWVLNCWALTKETPDTEEWLKKHGQDNKNANWRRPNGQA